MNDANFFYSFLKEVSDQVEFVDTFSHQEVLFLKSEEEVFVLYNHCPDNQLDANKLFSNIGIDESLFFEMNNW